MIYNQIDIGAQGVSISIKANEDEGRMIAFLTGLAIILLTIAISKSISNSKVKSLRS